MGLRGLSTSREGWPLLDGMTMQLTSRRSRPEEATLSNNHFYKRSL